VSGTLYGAQAVYRAVVTFPGGATVSKALRPGDIAGYRRVTITDTDADDDALCIATSVSLLSFEARGVDGGVELSWETGSELRNLGFHLHRAASENGPYTRITGRVIPGLGSSPMGARYRYQDSDLESGKNFFYKLEDLESTGRTKLRGPVSATAGPRETSPVPSPPSFITYGSPEATAFRVVRQSPQGVVLELTTAGFHAEPQEDGTVHVRIPGLEPSNEHPLPVLRPWVEVPAGGEIEITSIRPSSLESFTGLRPSGIDAREIVASSDGVVRAGRRRVPTVLSSPGSVPDDTARLLRVGFQGEARKAQLEIAPLRWNGAAEELVLARRLEVRLAFRGRAKEEKRVRGARRVLAQLVTTESGLHELRHEDLFTRGRGAALDRLRVSRLGKPVPFHVEGRRLYFLSDGPDANPYGHEAVFELETGGGGVPMALGEARPSGVERTTYLKVDDYEENRLYQAGLLQAPDPWLWEMLLAPVAKRFSFLVKDLRTESSRLVVWLQGASDSEAQPDHHVKLYVNGLFQHEISWDGKRSRKIEIDLLPGVLREGENDIEIENVGDTDAPYSMILLDRFQITYSGAAAAAGSALEGVWPQSGTALVSGLRASYLLDVTEERPRWLDGAELSADGVRFRAEAGRRYLAVSTAAVKRPAVRSVGAPRLERETNAADYLMIGPAELSSAAARLLRHRSDQGLRAKFAPLEDVYREFGYGEPRPEAIRDFLSFAYRNWREPRLRYVVLLGDATYDFKDYLATGVRNQVPPLMVRTSYLWTASDPALGAVHGDDLLPDVAIGRLPAKDAAELERMVAKILAYESGALDLQSPLVLVNDDADAAGDFGASADAIASGVLAGKPVRRLSLDELGASMRSEIRRAFDDGASLVSYVGHGGIHLWADENVLNVSDVSSFSRQAQQPILLTMNCLNGYFHFPYFDSLSEALVKAEGKGAIAAFSPSGLSLNESAHRFHEILLEALYHPDRERLGDAVLAAQEAYAEKGTSSELLTIYHLLGDPGLKIR
jgi:hypothetical protein